MKITVRGIYDDMKKEEIKHIIRDFCNCENVYAKADVSRNGNIKGVTVYPTGSKSIVGYISYLPDLKTPKVYIVIKRRQVVKTYTLRERGEA